MRAIEDPPTDPAAYRFCHRVRARFAETDAMGVVHHGAYTVWLEEARVEWLRACGHTFAALRSDGTELPVVEIHVAYLRPVRFDEEVDVHLRVASARGATFEIGYLLTVAGARRARAVSVHGVTGPHGRPVRCPPWLAALAGG